MKSPCKIYYESHIVKLIASISGLSNILDRIAIKTRICNCHVLCHADIATFVLNDTSLLIYILLY